MRSASFPPRLAERAHPGQVAIIGGGVAGCTLAEYIKLAWPGSEVVLLEGHTHLGGLSVRSEPDEIGWDRFYHVVTPKDDRLLAWLRRLGIAERVRFRRVGTGFYSDGRLHSLSTPLDFLRFPPLSLLDKARLGATILYAAKKTDGSALETVTAEAWLRRLSGRRTYEKIWGPLLRAKLGPAHGEVAASFMWSTIRRLYSTREGEDRREAFGYISGGYAPVFEVAERHLLKMGVKIHKNFAVMGARMEGERVVLDGPQGMSLPFDRVIFTGPSRLVPRLFGGLPIPERLLQRASELRYLGVICMVLKLRRALSPYYVLNITEEGLPFTGVIGLTTLVDPTEVGGHHLIYLPRYLPEDHEDFDRPDEAFYQPFMDGMRRIFQRRGFVEREVELWRVFRTRHVSPIHVRYYDRKMLPITLVPGRLYLVNTGRVLGGTLNNSQMIEEVEKALPTVLSPG